MPGEGVILMISHYRLGYSFVDQLPHEGHGFRYMGSPIYKIPKKDDLAVFFMVGPRFTGTVIAKQVQHTSQRVNVAVDISNYVKHPCN